MIHIDPAYLVRILNKLISINSVNPGCDSAGPGEGEIARWVADEFNAFGFAANRIEIAPGRFNVIARRSGKGGGKSLMWNAHLDTVGAGAMEKPFQPRQVGGKLFGRGAVDMKASLAAMLAAARAIARQEIQLAGDLVVAAVADEEWGSLGTQVLIEETRTDGAIVTEPTGLLICRAHRGFIHYRVETLGRAAHGSRFDEGIDANLHMGRVLWHLGALEKELRTREPVPLVGVPSLHAALLSGGSEMSIYAARCELNIERRTIPGEDPAKVRQEFAAILDRLAAEDPCFDARLAEVARREPFWIEADKAIVHSLHAAFQRFSGQPAQETGMGFWTDAALLSRAGIETVVFGPRGGGLHSDEEWVDIQSAMDLAGILAETAVIYCNEAK